MRSILYLLCHFCGFAGKGNFSHSIQVKGFLPCWATVITASGLSAHLCPSAKSLLVVGPNTMPKCNSISSKISSFMCPGEGVMHSERLSQPYCQGAFS